jgi:hypothetical protein
MRRSALIVGPNCGRKPCVWTREFWGVGFAKVTSPSGRSDARGQVKRLASRRVTEAGQESSVSPDRMGKADRL